MAHQPFNSPESAAFSALGSPLGHGPGLLDPDALFDEGILCNFKKEYEEAIAYLEQAQRLYISKKQLLGVVRCVIELAWQRYNHGDTEGTHKVQRLFAEALQMMQGHGQEPGVNDARARLLHYQGLVQYREKQFGEAIKHFRQARTFCRPQSLEAAKINDSFGIHYERTGDYNRAVKCLQAALATKRKLAIPHEEAITLQILGRLHLQYEEFPLAQQFLDAALTLCQSLGDVRRVADIQNDLIKLSVLCHDTVRALRLIHTSENQNRDKGFWVPYATTLLYKSYLRFGEKDYKACSQLLQEEVIPIFKRHKAKKGYGLARRMQASVEHRLGQHIQAIEFMGEALSIFKEGNWVDELAKTHFELGKLYFNMGEEALALASMLESLKIAEANDLSYLTSYIEDEIFRIDEARWMEIVDKRSNHQRVFDKEHTLLDALSALTTEDHPGGSAQSKSLLSLLRVGQAIAGERDLEKLLALIKDETELALNADRCTVFLYDRDTNELWSRIASGLEQAEEIRFPAHLGLSGYVCKTGEILNIKNTYDDPRFNREIDRKTGYKTENLLCIPMRNRRQEIMGVFQVLNKKTGPFEKADEDLLMAIASSAGVAIENAKLSKDQKLAFESFIKTLSSTIDARDPITAGHSQRVADYSTLVGERMVMTDEDMEALKYAALLHDIGKIGVKEEILFKDGRLTEKEYQHIQKHVYYTYEILKNIHFEPHLRTVPEIAASHHEKIDGTGYFRGLQGNAIPLSGRIIAVSDVFDAITSRRHYRNRMPFDRVINILHKGKGNHFDPDCVEMFFQIRLQKLAQVLLREKGEEFEDVKIFNLVKTLDPHITIAEYEKLLGKTDLTPGETQVHQVFTTLYHQMELSDLD